VWQKLLSRLPATALSEMWPGELNPDERQAGGSPGIHRVSGFLMVAEGM
jgi:hypothetical protein